jgi:hypothetical protein
MIWEISSPKTTRTKWTGSVAQAVGHLLCKCKGLSLNYSPKKKPKQTNKKREEMGSLPLSLLSSLSFCLSLCPPIPNDQHRQDTRMSVLYQAALMHDTFAPGNITKWHSV